MAELSDEQKLERMAVGDKAILNNKFVWRETEYGFRVNGELIRRQGAETVDKLRQKVLIAVGSPIEIDRQTYVSLSPEAKRAYHRESVRKSRAKLAHPCQDCGAPVSKKASPRCPRCAYAARKNGDNR